MIDQVEDPELKRALENPANPNEPKGLGTAATRDTILPKLMKSHYVALLKGKDPAIEVTEVGLAFITVVRRVFPAYGDPVGRAVFEAELAEIGRASTRAEAVHRADLFRQRTRARLDELIAAISSSPVLSLDPGALPPSPAASQPPTRAMIEFASSLAKRKGLRLPRGLKGNSSLCRAFLNEHAGPHSSHENVSAPVDSARAPSPAMLRYAQYLARQLGIACPAEAETSFTECRRFLEAHAGNRSGEAATESARQPRQGRQSASPTVKQGKPARKSVRRVRSTDPSARA